MNKTICLMLAMVAVALAGCQTAPPQLVWHRPDTTEAQFRQDAAACQMRVIEHRQRLPEPGYSDAGTAGQHLYNGFSSLAARQRQQSDEAAYYRACMESKGYTLR